MAQSRLSWTSPETRPLTSPQAVSLECNLVLMSPSGKSLGWGTADESRLGIHSCPSSGRGTRVLGLGGLDLSSAPHLSRS